LNGASLDALCDAGSGPADVEEPPPHLPVEKPQRYEGDARNLSFLPEASVDLIVTSPAYWQRRDYNHPRQLGLEPTPEAYIETLVDILNGWVRLLRPHGSIFLNLGDTYRDGFLAGIPARFEVAARQSGWQIPNHIVWTKSIGSPEPRPYRLASRHEVIFQYRLNNPFARPWPRQVVSQEPFSFSGPARSSIISESSGSAWVSLTRSCTHS
jgi:hypothetical protein